MSSLKRDAGSGSQTAYAPFEPGWADFVHAPEPADNKYSRGVVGFLTGSRDYPGAAILSVSAAMRFGVGMVRFLGVDELRAQVIAVRPEVVAIDISVRPLPNCDAWVVGSGVPADLDSADSATSSLQLVAALAQETSVPLIVDAGALQLIDLAYLGSNCILTPHAGEAVRLLARFGVSTTRAEVEADAIGVAQQLANLTGAVILLKGSRSVVSGPGDVYWRAKEAPAELATAGTGDVLAGLVGALAATNSGADLFELVKFAVWLHAQSAYMARTAGPIAALDLTEALRGLVGEILEGGYVNA